MKKDKLKIALGVVVTSCYINSFCVDVVSNNDVIISKDKTFQIIDEDEILNLSGDVFNESDMCFIENYDNAIGKIKIRLVNKNDLCAGKEYAFDYLNKTVFYLDKSMFEDVKMYSALEYFDYIGHSLDLNNPKVNRNVFLEREELINSEEKKCNLKINVINDWLEDETRYFVEGEIYPYVQTFSLNDLYLISGKDAISDKNYCFLTQGISNNKVIDLLSNAVVYPNMVAVDTKLILVKDILDELEVDLDVNPTLYMSKFYDYIDKINAYQTPVERLAKTVLEKNIKFYDYKKI